MLSYIEDPWVAVPAPHCTLVGVGVLAVSLTGMRNWFQGSLFEAVVAAAVVDLYGDGGVVVVCG